MTTAVDRPVAPGLPQTGDVMPLSRRWIHGLLYLALVLSYFATINFDGSMTSDDGAYGWQIYALQDDTWPLERTLPVVAADNEGIINASVGPDGPWPYSRHPAYVLGQRALANRLGLVGGAYALSILALVLFPFVVSATAASLDRTWAVPALWLAAASPLAINGTGVWAHAPAAVLAALSLWAAIRLVQKPSLLSSALLAASLAAGVLMRTEAVLWAVALTVSIVVVARDLPRVLSAASGFFAAAVATVIEQGVAAELVAGSLSKTASSDAPVRLSFLAGRVPAAWHELFAGSLVGGAVGLLAIVGMITLLFGAVRFRQARVTEAKVLAWVGIALHVLRIPMVGTDLISGIVTAWPAAIVLLIAVPMTFRPPLRLVAVAGTIFTLLVLATQYSGTSGDGWGGRYLSNLIPVLCLLGAAAFAEIDQTKLVRGIAIAVLAAPLASGMVGAHNRRTLNAESVDYILQVETDVVVSEQPALPRLAWAQADAAEWYRSTPDALAPFLTELASADVERITIQGFRDQSITLAGYDVVEVDNGLRQLLAR